MKTVHKMVAYIAITFITPIIFAMEKGPDIFELIRQGNKEAVERETRAGAHINDTNSEGLTPLVVALEMGNDAIIKHLLDEAAELPSLETLQGVVPEDTIHFIIVPQITTYVLNAARRRVNYLHLSRYIHFLSLTSGLRQVKMDGQTLLHLAIMNGDFDLANYLIDKDEDLADEKNKFNQTPLELGYGLFGEHEEKWNKFIAHIKLLSTKLEHAVDAAKRAWHAAQAQMKKEAMEAMEVVSEK